MTVPLDEIIAGSVVENNELPNQDVPVSLIDVTNNKSAQIMKAPRNSTFFIGVSLK